MVVVGIRRSWPRNHQSFASCFNTVYPEEYQFPHGGGQAMEQRPDPRLKRRCRAWRVSRDAERAVETTALPKHTVGGIHRKQIRHKDVGRRGRRPPQCEAHVSSDNCDPPLREDLATRQRP